MLLAKLVVDGVSIRTKVLHTIPKGIVGATIELYYNSPEWQHLKKTVVFQGHVTKDVLEAGTTVEIPAEVVAENDCWLSVGVYGTDAENNIVIPTLWCNLGPVVEATDPSGDETTNPALPVWVQILNRLDEIEEQGGIPGPSGPKGDTGPQGPKGDSGADGYSPSAKVEQTSSGARITITDKDGTTTAEVRNGRDGSGEGGGPSDAVLYTEQTLTDEQQAQARTNIGAVSIGEVEEMLGMENEKTVIGLDETAPEETVPSICDFMLTPTTPEAAYGLYYIPFFPDGQFFGNEVPVLTTKGTLSVKDADGNTKYSKYVEPMFNTRGVSDVLTHRGLEKKWSKKFYLTKEPISVTNIPPQYSWDIENDLFVWEFDESEFVNTGIPAKIHDIPMASPCFINNDDSENNVNNQALYNGTPYPAFFSYNEETGKYTLTARGIQGSSIKYQLTHYSKVHFYYQLETPYVSSFAFAMGIDAGDRITFDVDLTDNQPYIDALSDFKDRSVEPTVTAFVPRNVEDAMDGMNNAAAILNKGTKSNSGDATVQGYSWIGEGDGSTDYTVIIQTKLDELHKISDGGTIHLGPGTYPISKSLIVYGNTQIIGNYQTVIEQRSDNTHAIIVNGSDSLIKDLTIKLSGVCTSLTACVLVNSNNMPNVSVGYDAALPDNFYAQNVTIENVSMMGEYKFSYENGYAVISDASKNYKGVGIHGTRMYFNFAHVENVCFYNLYAGIYGGGSSNYLNVSAISCRYGIYATGDVALNTYFIDGHSYYDFDANGNHITMSEKIAYVETDTNSTYHLRCFDSQGFKNYIFLDAKTHNNQIDILRSVSTGGSMRSDHEWNLLHYYIIDYGWGNVYNNIFKHTPFHIGSRTTTIARTQQLEVSDPVIQNALSGAGIWGNISSNVDFTDNGLTLRDVCRYPSEKVEFADKNYLPYILSTVAPSEDNPIEIIIDYSNRPVHGLPNYFIQFWHDNVASDYVVSFDTTNTGVFDFAIPVTNNTNVTDFYDYPMVGETYTSYRVKFSFTKALQIPHLDPAYGDAFAYNPDGLIGICNIGMTVNDYAGRSFLGQCGGSLYGNVDMHQNTLKNLPDPVDDGDAVSKAHMELRLAEIGIGDIETALDAIIVIQNELIGGNDV